MKWAGLVLYSELNIYHSYMFEFDARHYRGSRRNHGLR
jgi:hypothetical protein